MGKTPLIVIAVLVVVAVVVGLVVGLRSPEPKEATLKIGGVYPLSGVGAPWGIPWKNGSEMAIDYINDAGGITVGGVTYTLELISYDNKMDVTESVTVASKLIYSDKVGFIVGPPCSHTNLAMCTLVNENQVLHITDGEAKAVIAADKPYVFRTLMTANENIPAFYDSLPEFLPDVEKVAIFNPNYEAGWDFMAWEKAAAATAGVEVVDSDFYETGAIDFSSLIDRFLTKNPDMVSVGGADGGTSALLVKQLREKGFTGPIYSVSSFYIATLLEVAGQEASQNCYQTYPPLDDPLMPELCRWVGEQYQLKYGEEASIVTILGWDTIMVIKQAIEAADSIDPSEARLALEGLESFDLITGTSKWISGDLADFYGSDHQALTPLYISKVVGDSLEVIKVIAVE